EDIFYSARAGMTKAHRGFFEFADARMGNFDEAPLFFDDTQKVLDVAKSHGWETVLFTSNDDVLGHRWIAERLSSRQICVPCTACRETTSRDTCAHHPRQ